MVLKETHPALYSRIEGNHETTGCRRILDDDSRFRDRAGAHCEDHFPAAEGLVLGAEADSRCSQGCTVGRVAAGRSSHSWTSVWDVG